MNYPPRLPKIKSIRNATIISYYLLDKNMSDDDMEFDLALTGERWRRPVVTGVSFHNRLWYRWQGDLGIHVRDYLGLGYDRFVDILDLDPYQLMSREYTAIQEQAAMEAEVADIEEFLMEEDRQKRKRDEAEFWMALDHIGSIAAEARAGYIQEIGPDGKRRKVDFKELFPDL